MKIASKAVAGTITGLALVLASCGAPQAVSSPDGSNTPESKPAEQTQRAAEASSGRSVTVAANGDILIHNSLWIEAQKDGGGQMDFSPQLAGVRKRISAADFAICHLETPLANPGGPYGSYPVFNTPPQVVRAIKTTGYDACSTASNHTLDQGFTGVKRTLDTLDAAGIGHSGSARTQAESQTPRIYEVNGIKIAHFAYTSNFNGYSVPKAQPWCCNSVVVSKMIADAQAARASGADIVITSMHAGDENSPKASSFQQEVAGELARSGLVNLILGNHTHVVQPAQKIGNMWVVYGHGNLLSGQLPEWRRNREGVISEFTFTEQSDGSFATTKAVGYPVFNASSPSRLVDLVTALPTRGGDARLLEAYQRTRSTLLSLGAGRDGFVVPKPGTSG